MENAPATTQTNAVANRPPPQAPKETLAGDFVVPKGLLMQGTSEFVGARKAQNGDIVRSSNVEVLGGPEKSVEVIPLFLRNMWIDTEFIPGQERGQFRGSYVRTPLNDNQDWDYTVADSPNKWKRTKVIELFALLPADIAARQKAIAKFKKTGEVPDLSASILPVVFSFRSTSFKAGKDVSTQFGRALELSEELGVEVPPFQYKMNIGCVQTSNDQGTYYIFKVDIGKKTEGEELKQAVKWRKILTAAEDIKVDESDETMDSTTAPPKEDQF